MARARVGAVELAVFVGALLGVSSATAQTGEAPSSSEGAAGAPGAANDREAARAAFERGLSLVRESRYAEAKAAFLEAYKAYPHYLVLYNVAQADVQLGNLPSAISYLERFLREGAEVLSAERRQQVSQQLAELRQKLASERSPGEGETAEQPALAAEPRAGVAHPSAPQEPPEAAPQPPEPPAATPSPAPSIAPAAIGSVTQVATPFVAPPVAPAPPAPALDTDRTWGLVLGASGIALLGLASGLYLWNDSRHDGWKEDREALDALPDRDQRLASDLDVWRQARANNELLESIERVDVVTIIAAGVGAVALAAGTWEVLAKRTPTPTIAASHSGLSWRSSW